MTTQPQVFLKEVTDELKKVVWPTRSEVTRLTVVVIVVSLIVGVFLGGIDFLLTKLMETVIK